MFLHLSLAWGVFALTLLLIGWFAARKGNTRLHKKIMIFLTLGAWVFVGNYLLQYQSGHIPDVPPELMIWMSIHGTVAMAPLLGAIALIIARLRSHKNTAKINHINHHHRVYGRVLVVLWIFTHLGGFVNYYLFT